MKIVEKFAVDTLIMQCNTVVNADVVMVHYGLFTQMVNAIWLVPMDQVENVEAVGEIKFMEE